MAAQTLYLRSTQSGLITTTTCRVLSTTQGGATTTTTTVKEAAVLNTIEFIPGTATNTTAFTTGTTPGVAGFLFDAPIPGNYDSTVWTVDAEIVNSGTTGTCAVKASVWVVEPFGVASGALNRTSLTSITQLANAVSSGTFTPSTSASTKSITFTPSAFTLRPGQTLYLELYLTSTVAGTSTSTTTLDLDDSGVNASRIITSNFTPSTLLNPRIGRTDAGTSVTAGTAISITPTATNYLYMVVITTTAEGTLTEIPTFSGQTGWTQSYVSCKTATSGVRTRFYYKFGATASSATFTYGSSRDMHIQGFEILNGPTADPVFDPVNTNLNSVIVSTAPYTAGALGTYVVLIANGLAITFTTINQTATGDTGPSGWTKFGVTGTTSTTLSTALYYDPTTTTTTSPGVTLTWTGASGSASIGAADFTIYPGVAIINNTAEDMQVLGLIP